MHLGDLKHPNELHGLSPAQLEDVARQIRERHLQVVSTSGGHLGPGLGVVELTLALYQTLDLDHDRVVWDVGHQAYPHKLITGRFNDFDSLRQQHGVAGYLKRSESDFDHFGAGHASTSISAALGMEVVGRPALVCSVRGSRLTLSATLPSETDAPLVDPVQLSLLPRRATWSSRRSFPTSEGHSSRFGRSTARCTRPDS